MNHDDLFQEAFTRIRATENSTVQFKEQLSQISKQLEEHAQQFKEHDTREMSKFTKITDEIASFKRLLWIGLGIVIGTSEEVQGILKNILGAMI